MPATLRRKKGRSARCAQTTGMTRDETLRRQRVKVVRSPLLARRSGRPRRGRLSGHDRFEQVRRPRARPTPPRGLTLAEVARLLAVIPEIPTGLLDRVVTITALLTGLRRTELRDLRIVGLVPGQAARYEVSTKGSGLRAGDSRLPRSRPP